jgi:hypothetical protein
LREDEGLKVAVEEEVEGGDEALEITRVVSSYLIDADIQSERVSRGIVEVARWELMSARRPKREAASKGGLNRAESWVKRVT